MKLKVFIVKTKGVIEYVTYVTISYAFASENLIENSVSLAIYTDESQ